MYMSHNSSGRPEAVIQLGDSGEEELHRMNLAPGVTASRVSGSSSVSALSASVGSSSSNRRPGQVPPFAVFSQEKRGRLQELYPEYNFGELGRRLSEMWHALTEEDKELYRRKARLIGVQKLKAWEMKRSAAAGGNYFAQQQQQQHQQQQSKLPPNRQQQQQQQQQQLPGSHGGPSPSIKRRRTHGYAIFMSEERKKHSTLNVPLGDVTRKVAEAWRSLEPSVRSTYEAKANRINAIENRRYQQALLLQQQRTSGAPSNKAHISPSQPPTSSGTSATPHLRITSVESLSRQQSVKPNVNLPSGITISRVEPEATKQPRMMNPRSAATSNSSKNNHLIDMRVNGGAEGLIDMRGGRSLPKMSSRVPPPLQRRPNHSNGIMPMSYALPGSAGMPMKRALPPQAPPLAKRAKHIIPPRPPLIRQGGSIVKQPAAAPHHHHPPPPSSIGILGTLDTWDKMCRLCGRTLIPIVPINEDPLILEKIRDYLGLELDLEDRGYPPGMCRKCAGMLNGFDRFKKVVSQGQTHLDELAKLKRERMGFKSSSSTEIVSYEEESNRRGRGASSESILPDLDIEIEDSVPRPMLPRPKQQQRHTEEEDEEGSLSSRSSVVESNGGQRQEEEDEDEDDDIDPDFDPLNFLQVSDVVGDYEEEEEESTSNGKDKTPNSTTRGEEEEEEEDRGSEKSTDDIQIANAIYESLMDQSAEESNGGTSPPPKKEATSHPGVDDKQEEVEVNACNGGNREEEEEPIIGLGRDEEEENNGANLSNDDDDNDNKSKGEEDLNGLHDNSEEEQQHSTNGSVEAPPRTEGDKSPEEGEEAIQSVLEEEEKYIESEMMEEKQLQQQPIVSSDEQPPPPTQPEEDEEDPFPEPPTHQTHQEEEVPPFAPSFEEAPSTEIQTPTERRGEEILQ